MAMEHTGLTVQTRRSLHIALVHASDLGGGAERSVVALHRGLRALGHTSTLYVGRKRTDEPGVLEIPYRRGIPGSRRLARGIERRFGWQDIYNPSFRYLVNLIPADTDIIHFHSLWGAGGFADLGALPVLTARWPGVITMRENWLITGHCACFHDCQRWRTGCGECPDLSLAPALSRDGTAFNWRRKRALLKRSRLHVVTISEWLRSVAEQSPILADKPISTIYNGIDLAIFAPVGPEYKRELRRAFGIPEDRIGVLLAGQTVEGIREGIAAQHAIAALNRFPAGRLAPVVVGHSAERFAECLNEPAVTLPFQTTLEDMARCYQAVDLCLVTSAVEAFGRIGAEAQACGTPVVGFATGGIPEVVCSGVGGRLVATGDVDGLVGALAELVADPALRRQYAENGRDYVAKHFDQQNIAVHHIALYRDILTRRHG